MVSVGAAWAVWSMMRCNAGRMAGSTRCGLVACGIPAALGGAGRGNDDGCGVGSYGGALGQRRGFGPASVVDRAGEYLCAGVVR